MLICIYTQKRRKLCGGTCVVICDVTRRVNEPTTSNRNIPVISLVIIRYMRDKLDKLEGIVSYSILKT